MYNGVVVTHEKNGFVYNERSKKNAKKGKDEEANVRTEVGLPPLLLQKRREEKRREEKRRVPSTSAQKASDAGAEQ